MDEPKPRMEFVLNERKAVQAAAHLLKMHGKPMHKDVLMTLMYLAERRSLVETGYPITGDKMTIVPDEPAH